jgi:hypothetical protein
MAWAKFAGSRPTVQLSPQILEEISIDPTESLGQVPVGRIAWGSTLG